MFKDGKVHILFCVNKSEFGTKCFVKREQFVLPFIKVALNNFLSSAKIGKTILLTIDAGEKGLCFIDSFTKEERSGRVRTVLNGKEGTFQFL